MRRYYLKKGDRTSAGGIVLNGDETCTHYGSPMTYLGAKVYCNACKTEGVITGRGPRLPDRIMGKESALDGDICTCKCDPPPVLFASQDTSWQEVCFDVSASLSSSCSELTDRPTSEPKYDDRFILRSGDGSALAHAFYAVQRMSGAFEYGKTDGNGATDLLVSVAYAENVNVYFAG